jgi:ligand-binding sensor domain-containing protein/signal transduction histidine kinase
LRPSPHRALLALVLLLGVATDPALGQRLAVRTFTTADGLAGDDISAILEDTRGFLWIGTSTGLSRFDGERFRNYAVADGLPHPDVNALLQDRRGALWIGTSGGLARIDPGAPRFERVPLGGLTDNSVRLLHQDRHGQIWVGAGAHLMVLSSDGDPRSIRHVPIVLPSPPPPGAEWEVESIAEDADGCLWIGTTWGLIQRHPDERSMSWRVRPGPKDDRIYHLSIDSGHRLWITHWGLGHRPGVNWGVYAVDLAHGRTAAGPPLHRIAKPLRADVQQRRTRSFRVEYATAGGAYGDARLHGAFPSRDGGLWFATENGLVRVNDAGVHRFGEEAGLGFPIRAVAEDRAGNLWLGGRGSGLSRLELGGLVTYTEHEGLGARRVVSILEDRAGGLCVEGTTADGAHWFGSFRAGRFMPFLPRGTAGLRYWGWGWQHTLIQDRVGEWWLATGSGLFRYPAADSCEALARLDPKAVYGVGNGLSGEDIFRIFEDSRGDVWVATFGDPGVFRWRRSHGAFEPLAEIGLRTPTAFAEDRDGGVWMGFYSGGLVRFHGGTWRGFDAQHGVPDGFVEDLLVDGVGRLWVATDPGGVVRVDDPTAATLQFVRAPSNDSSGPGTVTSIAEDRWGQLYMADGRGLARFVLGSAGIRRYSTADGLASDSILVSYRDRGGALWFGTEQGLSRLAPRVEPRRAPPSVFIAGVRIGGLPQPVSQLGDRTIANLTLDPPRGNVEIEYGAVSLLPGEPIQYQTKVEGSGDDWSAPSSGRSVLYANLGPGRYRFVVRAVGAGSRTGEPAMVTFTVRPPVWQRPWFIGPAILAVVVAVTFAYRARVSRLLALERVRTRIATDLHDDLGARLSRISIVADVAARDFDRDPAGARRLLEGVGETARELIEASADIAWSIDPRHEDLPSLVTRIRRFASDMFDPLGLRWTLEAPVDEVRLRLSPDQRRHILLIFQEAITNAARHSAASRVRLSLRVRSRRLEAEIVDDGNGLEIGRDHPTGSGSGLANIEARARALGGDVRIDSVNGGGTRVSLSVEI